jgi:hypothetical protein
MPNWKDPNEWDFDKIGGFLGDMGSYRMAQSPGRIGRPVARLGDPSGMMQQGSGGGAFGMGSVGGGNDPLQSLMAMLDDKAVQDMIRGTVTVEEMPAPYGDDEIKNAPRKMGRAPNMMR